MASVFLYKTINNEKVHFFYIFRASGNDKATIERPQKRPLTQLVALLNPTNVKLTLPNRCADACGNQKMGEKILISRENRRP